MEAALLSTQSPACAPQEFTLFGQLPPELRVKIWQEAMPEARTVVVRSPYTENRASLKSLEDAVAYTSNDDEMNWTSNTQIPSLLHVNTEARHEALKHYQLALGARGQEPRIYVDFSRDTLFFGNAELQPECLALWPSTTDIDRVQRLAVVPEGAWRVLRWMKSLQKVIFVHDTDNLELGREPQLIEVEEPEQEETTEEQQSQEQEQLPLEQTTQEQDEATVTEEGQTAAIPEITESEDVAKKRMQDAREELDNVMMVLSTHWDTQPALSTAVFATSVLVA